ncbi:Zn(2)-C6 fungal-type DNA-binding domain protein [Fusarium tjaetaba]|uniref:Zn(2)-C6 fungal-type DNA-binding domain protein n=1 Tax=Fusarium tjaetaba TaxID=1567544 RepID=A0A8H5VWT8_9HYPO|nr:Zn(2)-C6 fungal-type DNA-binding domain protein [Fusarium tjaetaba]KAF5638476.1 Zn(2)-C6 fungal-type DNA-binding domain protein [Fusarium tjaetaba]
MRECRYELCGSSETRTSTHIIRVRGSTTSYDRIYADDSEPPTSTRPLSELGPCGWDLTEYGQAELMQDMFAYRYRTYPEEVAEQKLKKTVDILLRERGCTLDTLLEDEVFESFPLARYGCMGGYEYEDRGLSMPGLILAILLVTTPPCNHMECLKTKRLYVTILAMLPILQSVLGRSNGVIRTQALVAVYEYGHGLYYQAYLNLNSAICMASRIEMPQSIHLEFALELRLSLMLLDCMLALSTHHRDEGWLPHGDEGWLLLICHPGHAMVRAVEDNLATLRTPEGDPRPGETNQSSLSMHQSVSIAGNSASCDYQYLTAPLTSATGTDNPQPPPTDCFLFLGHCGWDLTEHAQAQLMKAMLAYDSNDAVAKAGLGDNVMRVFRDRGCTIQELLKDPAFESLPLVESLRTTGSPHRSHPEDSSWPILHLAVLLVATPPCDHKACSQTKRLYVTVKALFALTQLHLPNHAELVQTQGLIALYECGHGMLEHAHVTLNSAFTMAARLDVDLSSILTSLEWRLSLMLIDILVALQALHRKHDWIPLACPPHHDMVKAIKHNFTVLKTPNGTPRPDLASQRVLELGTIAFQCGHILQHVHDSKRVPRTANPHCELMVEFENSHPPFDEYTVHLDIDLSIRLPTSCIFAHTLEMYDLCYADIPFQEVDQARLAAARLNHQRELDLQRAFTRRCRARAAIDAQLSFATNSSGEEDQKQFSLVRIIPVIPEMRRLSRRWPAAEYVNQISDDIQKRQRSKDTPLGNLPANTG